MIIRRIYNELNYELLGIDSYYVPIVYYDDYVAEKSYNVFEVEEYYDDELLLDEWERK